MTEQETVAVSPDLSRLDRETRIRVAVTQGWTECRTVSANDDTSWYQRGSIIGLPPGWKERSLGPFGDDGEPLEAYDDDFLYLPNYLHDPAAWGALEDAERVEVMYGYGAYAGLVYARCAGADWEQAPTRPQAICAAVLAMHGVEP